MANFVADGVSMTGREIRTVNGEFGGGNGLSLDVVKELQVITNGFKAETGQTGAGTISIVTKSGTNTVAGSAYGFWRPTDWVAANLLTGAKTTQKRQQFGGTIGGPLQQGRHALLRQLRRHRHRRRGGGDLGAGAGDVSRRRSGSNQGFFKLNNRFNDRTAFDARYSFNRNRQETQGVGGLNTFERRSNTEGRTDAFVTSLVSNFGSNKVNEARFRYTYDVVDFYSPLTAPNGAASRTPDFSTAPVTVTYTGVGNLGTNPGFPQNLVEKRGAVGGSLLGGERARTSSRPASTSSDRGGSSPSSTTSPAPTPSRRARNTRSTRATRRPSRSSSRRPSATSGLNFKDAMVGVFAQDDWEVRRGLTLNVGVRWDKDSLFQGDNNNFAPRAGFAWNVGGSARTVIRGNTGIFYDTLESSAINRESNTGPVGQTTIDLRQGDPLFPTFPNRLSAFPTGATTVARATVYVPIFEGDAFPGQHRRRVPARRARTSSTPTSACSTSSAPNWAVSADYARVYGYDLLVTWDINAPPFFALGPGQTRTVAQANALRPLGVPNRTGGPYNIPFTGFRNLYLQFNGGHTEYNAIKFGLNKRMSNRYAVQANYTLGHARGDVDNFRLTELVRARPDRARRRSQLTSGGRATPMRRTCSW